MKDLVKNPIGIIALFISLIYAFANLLLGTTAQTLQPDERFPLIMFIVLFPIVVLGVFYLLVSRHHGKLYAPGDYKDDKSFLRTLSQEEREQKLQKEAEETSAAADEPVPALAAPETTDQQRPATLQPEPIPTSPSNLTRVPEAARVADIRSEIQLVEGLVISKFESELKLRADRDVGIGGTGASFDALFHTGEQLTFLEVKLVRHLGSFGLSLDRMLYNAVIANQFLESRFKLIVAVVHDLSESEVKRLETLWLRRVTGCPAALELRLIRRSELNG